MSKDTNVKDYAKLLQQILDIGEEMLVCGAEVNRVEDSIIRMCQAYDARRINVYIITSNIQVTFEDPMGNIITQIRCVERSNVNYQMLQQLNDTSRYICANKPSTKEIETKVFKILDDSVKEPLWFKYLGPMIVAGSFAIFFGGDLRDGIAAVFVGALMKFMNRFMNSREPNELVYYFMVSVVASVTSLILVAIGLGHNYDKIMIGAIMIIIPGIAMTNAIRDMIIGDIYTGLLRFCSALLIAGAIACGFALGIIALGGII